MRKLILAALLVCFAAAGPVLADTATQTRVTPTTATVTVTATTDGAASAGDSVAKPKSD